MSFLYDVNITLCKLYSYILYRFEQNLSSCYGSNRCLINNMHWTHSNLLSVTIQKIKKSHKL